MAALLLPGERKCVRGVMLGKNEDPVLLAVCEQGEILATVRYVAALTQPLPDTARLLV